MSLRFPIGPLAGLLAALVLTGCPTTLNTQVEPLDGGDSTTDGGGGGGLEICDNQKDDDGDGQTDCADSNCFNNAACFLSCVDLCSENTPLCDSNGVRKCEMQANGCREYGAATACGNGLVCSGGQCVATCTDRCTEGTKQCAAGAVVECKKLATGCNEWVNPTQCGTDQVCSGGSCVNKGSCTDQCTENDTQCTATGQIKTCVKLMSGCTEWSIPVACAGANTTCALPGKVCVTQTTGCTPNDKRCNSTNTAVELCDSQGQWMQSEACAVACVNNACATNAQCTPGQPRCNGNSVETCNSSGTAWLITNTCAVACSNGLCTGACTPGDKRCNQNKVEECDAAGTAWTVKETCANACDISSAQCALSSLEVTAPNTALEGLVIVNGPVTVRTGASIVSQTGDLTIRANSIVVEQQGAITAIATGATSAGGGGTYSNGTSTCYRYGGGGGGYGTAGQSVSGGGGGSIHGVTTNSVVSMGSRGGLGRAYSCTGGTTPGGAGGGLIRLLANSITIHGAVSADGANGTPGAPGFGGGGGGSGGGILVAADQIVLSATGSISVAGGGGGLGGSSGGAGGNGGKGRVKVLYGTTFTQDGTIEGTLTQGLLPPLSVTSSTHPEPDRIYNDDFPGISLSWNKPFPGVQGYYHLTDATENRVPTPANGTFNATETVSLDPSKVKQGVNYFHITPLDASSTVGTIESTLKIQINTQPPTLSSASHPSQTAWNANRDVFFSWTFPNADSNHRGVYYVLDHYGDTIPTSGDTFVPVTQKQLLRSQLNEGVWVFHVVSADTMGYLNKTARHYTVRIGADPGVGQILSIVKDANGQNINGAKVTINRGLFASPDTVNGTSNVGSIPVGTWEVTVSKTGFQSSTQSVQVVKDQAVTANFTLVP